MSDISINISFSNDHSSERSQKKQSKFRRKRFLRQRKKKDAHSEQFICHQTPLHNGAATKHPSLPTSTQNQGFLHPDTTTSASHCSSRPSRAFTVNTEGSHEKPNEPVNSKSATTDLGSSASSNHKLTAAPGPSGPSSHKPVPAKYLAIDCEMVGTGPKGSISQLARCSIVSYEGDVVYDKFINPSMPVTDYRTRWSGIRRSDLIKATPYSQARKEVRKLSETGLSFRFPS